MTSNDLKTLASRELEDLPPMPSVVSDVRAEGARRQRRRRTVGAGLAAASVIGVIGLGASMLPGIGESTAPTDPAPSVASDGGPVTDTKAEFDEWAAQKFASVLPERFSAVHPKPGQHTFVTSAEGLRITFNINLTLTDWEHSDLDPSDIDLLPSCEEAGVANCAELPSQNAIAYHERADDPSAYAGMEMYIGDRSQTSDMVALNFFGNASKGPLPISNEEILALVDSPEFEQIWREYMAHPKWVFSSQHLMADTDSTRFLEKSGK